MKALILSVGLFLGSLVNSQNITFQDGLYYQDGNLYSGKYTLFFDNGAAKQDLNIKDGKLNGEIIAYHENGTKKEVGQYENNLKFGLWSRYSAAGKLTATASYKNDKKDGQWVVYNENGAKLFQMEYKEGEKAGTWYQWDDKGELIKTTTYSNM